MSVFDNKGTPKEVEEEVASYLEKLVAEKGEQWKDPEVIAKGKIESDRFIEDLKRQNAELREDLEKSTKMDEIISMLKSQSKAPESDGDSVNHSQNTGDHTDTTAFSDEKLRALVESQMAERESARSREKNIAEVDAKLVDKFGSNAPAIVKKQAEELGMSLEEARELAATKPKAFFRLMGLDGSNNSQKVLSGNQVRTEASDITNGPVRDWKWWQEKRRTAKSWYYANQKQLLKDKAALGERFGMPT